jgi:Flp pilus assembly protein TadD
MSFAFSRCATAGGLTALFCLSVTLLSPTASAIEHAAQIVALQGQGEAKEFNARDWAKASSQQKLGPGSFVRTGDMSNMALLFRDQTQVRLSQNSQLQIKTVAEVGDSNLHTAVRLNAGRAWAQTKNVTDRQPAAPASVPTGGPTRKITDTLTMETPTATMAIRGTDWDIEVGDNGKSTVTVLSGRIEFFNDYGSITVNNGEQAVAEHGKAPVKLLISNPRERVQWVTSYEVDPLRHIRLSPTEGIAALEAGIAAERSAADRGAAFYDLRRRAEAKQAFEQALATQNEHPPALIGMGLLSLLDNDLDGAARWLKKVKSGELAALAQTALLVRSGELRAAKNILDRLLASGVLQQPAAHLILADFLASQGNLAEAIAADHQAVKQFPRSAQIHAHLAKLHLLADQNDAGTAAVTAALNAGPDMVEPYLAQGENARWNGNANLAEAGYGKAVTLNAADDRGWFGLGAVLNEKEDARRGREKLLRATELNPDGPGYKGELGVLETFANRFDAAAEHFSSALQRNPDDYVALTGYGVMLLKRGQTDAALEQFLKASVIEPRYARVHLYTGIAYYQLGRTARAMEEIDKAKVLDPRDPMLSTIASMMYTDHFDLARAVEESRNANELMPYLKSMNQIANNQKGAANVGNSLAFWGMRDWATHYAQESYSPYWAASHLFLADQYEGKFAKTSELFQGYLTDPTIFGASNRFQTLINKPGNYQTYMLTAAQDGQVVEFTPRVTINGYNSSLIPVAYFLNSEENIGKSRPGTDFDYANKTRSFTGALGIMPTHELRLFTFFSRDSVKSDYKSNTIIDLNYDQQTDDFSTGGSYAFSPTSLLRIKYGRSQLQGGENVREKRLVNTALWDREISHDYQTAWQGKINDTIELSGGIEHATSPESSALTITRASGALLFDDQERLTERTNLRYLSGKFSFAERSYVQLDAIYTDYEKTINGSFFNRTRGLINERFSVRRLSPRVGLAWDLGRGHNMRIAYQDWVRPSSSGTLGAVATAGIPLNETLVRFGGRVKRTAAQLESEWSPTLYTKLSLDHKVANNLGTLDISLAEYFATLSKVQNRGLLDVMNSAPKETYREYENLHNNERANLDQIRLSANKILTSTISATASYLNTQSDIRIKGDPRTFYLPRHQVVLGASWVSPLRVRLNADVNWRSEAYTFLNLDRHYAPYLSSNLSAYWETRDKRVGLVAFIRDAFSPHDSTFYGVAASYRH